MKPVNIGGHAAYRNALRKRLRVCYPNFKVIFESQWRIYKKFRDLDLSPRNAKKPSAQSAAIETGPDGVPVCPAGLKMKPNGADLKRRYVKFRCPLMSKGKCRCDAPCSSAKFGRTFSVAMKTNPRLHNFPPRESREWKKTYNARTASERANKRIKNDYHLEDGHHRSTRMWYVRLYAIVMSLHLDAWPVS